MDAEAKALIEYAKACGYRLVSWDNYGGIEDIEFRKDKKSDD